MLKRAARQLDGTWRRRTQPIGATTLARQTFEAWEA